MACHTPDTNAASRRCVCVGDSASSCSRGKFCYSNRSDSSSHQCGYACERSMSIFGRTAWNKIRTDNVCAPNGYSSSDTLSRPIVENVARIPRICTVYHRYEVFCVPIIQFLKLNKIINYFSLFCVNCTHTPCKQYINFYLQRASSEETFTTDITLMRSFPAVRSHVVN